MKIQDARIDMKVRAENGYEGEITGIWPDQVRIETATGVHYRDAGCIEPVSDPCFAIGEKVRATGKSIYDADIEGKTFEVVDPGYHSRDDGSVIRVTPGDYLIKPENLVKCGPCESCEMAATMSKQMAELQSRIDKAHTRIGAQDVELGILSTERDEWREATLAHSMQVHNCLEQLAKTREERDQWQVTAAYWREELEKLQKEALEDAAPIHPAIDKAREASIRSQTKHIRADMERLRRQNEWQYWR